MCFGSGNASSPYTRQIQRLFAVRIARGVPQRSFVDEQPRFLHSHRDHTDHRRCSYSGLPPGTVYFCQAIFDGSTLGVSMDEEQIGGIQFNAPVYAFRKAIRWIRHAPQIGEFPLYFTWTASFS